MPSVNCPANRSITEVKIDADLLRESDPEQLEDLLILACNRALEKAEKVAEAEMAGVARNFMPGMGS